VSRLSYFKVGTLAQFVNSVSSVESATNLLIGVHEALELSVEVSVLTVQNATVVTEGLNLTMGVIVTSSEGLVGETEFFLLTSGYSEVVVGIAMLALQVVEVGGEISVAAQLNFGPSGKVGLLGELSIELTSKFTLLLLETSLFISSTAQVSLRVVESLSSSAEVEVSGFSGLLEFSEFLLVLVERVISSFDSLGTIGVLSFLHGVHVSQSLDLLTVSGLLFSQVSKLVRKVIYVVSKCTASVSFLLAVTSGSVDLSFTTGDLLTGSSNLSLEISISSVLLVEKETSIVNLLSESSKSDEVRFVSGLEIVVLEQLFIGEVAVLGLDGVKLIAECEVVLVSLLDFKDLSLELGD
jgi:hypothetical protein